MYQKHSPPPPSPPLFALSLSSDHVTLIYLHTCAYRGASVFTFAQQCASGEGTYQTPFRSA